MAEWRHALLKRLGYRPTKQNLTFLANWQRWEGGHTNNSARFNWLNTTMDAPGNLGSVNSVGVKRFKTFQYGIQALASTLNNGRYQDILNGLASGNPYSQDVGKGLQVWVSGKPDGNPAYAEKVLGGHYTPIVERGKKAAQSFKMKAAALPKDDGSWKALVNAIWHDNPEIADLMSSLDDHTARKSGIVSPGGYISAVPSDGALGKAQGLLKLAGTQIGKPYLFGSGPDTSSFDCSDLIQWAYGKIGIKLPRTTFDQIHVGKGVNPRGKLKPGDLVFPSNHHVVMYVGHGKVIAAPHTGTVVQYQDLSSFGDLLAVRRIL